MDQNIISLKKQPDFELVDDDGFNQFQYLIDQRNKDYDSLDKMYDHIDSLHLRDCEIFNIILNKKVILNAEFHSREDALMNLDCTYWVKFLEDTKIRELMPYSEYSELLDNFKCRNKEKHIPFSEVAVHGFVERLINSKPILFAHKVNSVMKELDHTYKHNSGSMLPIKMILSTRAATFPGWYACSKIDDLRFSIRQIYGLDLDFQKTTDVFLYNDVGEWISVEGDLLRIKRFQNANVHIQLSDVVYQKLNEIISLVNENLLPETGKNIRKNTYKYEGDYNE